MQSSSDARRILKVLSNQHRLEMLVVLMKRKEEMCVNELASAVGISPSLASHQLAHLSAADIVESRRVGQTVCYLIRQTPFTKKVIATIRTLLT